MLNFSQEQIDLLSEPFKAGFEVALAKFLRISFPEKLAQLSAEQLGAVIRRIVQDASDCGISDAAPLAQFACLSILTRGKLLNIPEVAAFLSDRGVSPERRVRILLLELSLHLPKN